MTKASTRPRQARPTGAARRRARAAQRRQHRWALAASATAVVAGVGVVVGLHVTSDSSGSASTSSASAAPLQVGNVAPGGTFTTTEGKTVDVASLRGRPTLLWFVATWCSSCQAGTQAMAQNLPRLAADGVQVDEVELYRDLGQSGPSIGAFAKALAGTELSNPDWTFGVSSAGLTRTYDPQSYLDIYYLLGSKGQITYVNSSPASTMAQLLRAAARPA